MAAELGLFAAHGLDVKLSREVGWATVRDKVLLRELEAAHAPAAMVLTNSLGIGSFKFPCVTGLVLNLHGNAITLSNRLWEAGVRDSATLREFVLGHRGKPKLAFGVAFSCSSHNFLLRAWLRAGGLDPGRDVNIVVVPPPQMAANLKAGNLDGYCVGEPWNSVAVLQRAGWVAAASARIAPLHPEKVLLARADFVEARDEEHRRLIVALHEACAWCQRPENRNRLAATLAQPQYLNTNPDAVRLSLCQPFRVGKDEREEIKDFHTFAGPEVNEPGPDKAAWVRESLLQSQVLPKSMSVDKNQLAAVFRLDLFHSALGDPRSEDAAGAKAPR
jgi:ABC-type nitrate/sulfonate/bicarbonate transport system substrate-binding protein